MRVKYYEERFINEDDYSEEHFVNEDNTSKQQNLTVPNIVPVNGIETENGLDPEKLQASISEDHFFNEDNDNTSKQQNLTVQNIVPVNETENGLDPEKLQALISDFQKVEDVLNKSLKLSGEFLNNFCEWQSHRLMSITILEKLAEELDSKHFTCNVAKLAGSSVGVAGGIIGIIGAALIPFTAGISSILFIVGGATGIAGGVTNIGTAVTETVLASSIIEQAKSQLLTDKEKTKVLLPWFKCSAELVEAVEKICDFDVFQSIINSLQNIVPEGKSLESVSRSQIATVVSTVIYKLSPVHCISQLIAIFNIIIFIPQLFQILVQILKLHKNYPVIFETILLTLKITLQILRAADVGVDAATSVIAFIRAGASSSSRAIGLAVAHGIFGAVTVALDVTSLVLTSIDVHGGSKSEQAKMIRDAKDDLEREFNNITNIYTEINSKSLHMNTMSNE